MTRNKINELLSERHQRFSPLQRLLRQASDQDAWTAELRAVLPDELARECQVLDVRGATILVACRSASSATKLRFMADEVIGRLRVLAGFRAARDIRIRVHAGPSSS